MQVNNFHLHYLVVFTFVLSSLLTSRYAIADVSADEVIKKAYSAYGGNNLTRLESLTFKDTLNIFASGQSAHPIQGLKMGTFSEQMVALTIDYKKGRSVFKRAYLPVVGNHSSNIPSVTHRLFTENGGFSIDHTLGQYTVNERITRTNLDSNTRYLLDTLIIKTLNQKKQGVELIDIALIEGQPQFVIETTINNQQATLFFDQKNYYLTRMIYGNNDNKVTYNYLEHLNKEGITFSTETVVSFSDNRFYHSTNRDIKLNQAEESLFLIPQEYTLAAKDKFIDSSHLSITKLADSVFFIGKDWSYTLFVDTGEYYVSTGSWQDTPDSTLWNESLALLESKTKIQKPVKYHIVTHHHDDHMMGLRSIVESGTNLILHSSNTELVNKYFGSLASDRLTIVGQDYTHPSGKITLFDIPTSHANHHLMVYLPQEQILMTEDVFGSSLVKGIHSPALWPEVDTYARLKTLDNELDKRHLSVDLLMSSHHPRGLTKFDIENALETDIPNKDELINRLFGSTL